MRAQQKERQLMVTRMNKVAEDQVWLHQNGTEYTTILITNKDATKPGYEVTVCYYGPDGRYWSQDLERFVKDKRFDRKYESVMTPAEVLLAPWMSACLADDVSCTELKTAAGNWLNELPIAKEPAPRPLLVGPGSETLRTADDSTVVTPA
jgi:hypothetical protein